MMQQDNEGMIRVVHVVHWPKSGIVSLLRDMLPLFDKCKFEMHVVFFEYDADTIKEFSGLCASVHVLYFSENTFKGLILYCKLMNDISPDILHSHSFQPGIWGRAFRFFSKTKFVCTIHSPYPYLKTNDFKSTIKRFIEFASIKLSKSSIICVSDNVKNQLGSVGQSDSVNVIKNGIEIRKFYNHCAIPSVDRNLTSNHTIKLVTLGRLSPEKGIDVLLHGLKHVIDGALKCKLLIIGDGDEREQLEELILKLDLEKFVTFAGYQDRPYHLLASADIYICSSFFEGLPLSLCEAMSIGLPVIATTAGGIPELIKDGINGFLIEPGDPQCLAEAIIRLVNDNRFARKIAKAGQENVEKNFNIINTVDKYQHIYTGLI